MPNYKKVNAGGSKLVTNCETRTTGNSIKWWERYYCSDVWVQFTVKKNRVDDKNFLHLKYLTSQKLQLFFFLYLERFPFTHFFVLSLNLDQYAVRLNSVHIMTKVTILNKKNLGKIWKLIYMVSHQKNKSGTKCWLTCLFNLKSATILSNGRKPENVL